MQSKTIKVGNRRYSVAVVDIETFNLYLHQKNIFDADVKSFVDYDEQIILIKDSLSTELKQELLIHEILHACLADSGIMMDDEAEKFVTMISPRVSALISDNNLAELAKVVQ